MHNREDGRETYKSKLKCARSSNYDLYLSLFEVLDNSSSTGVESKNIKVKLYVDDDGLYKIMVEDDGNGIKNILETAAHGYYRERDDAEGNEFGHGYKAAAINISDKLIMFSKCKKGKYQRAVWDQKDMSNEDRYLPKYSITNCDEFNEYKDFKNKGTISIYENLRENTIRSFDLNKLKLMMEKRYKYWIKNRKIKFHVEKITGSNKDENKCEILKYSEYEHDECFIDLFIYKKNIDLIFFYKNSNKLYNINCDEVTINNNGNYNKTEYKKTEIKDNIENDESYELVCKFKFITKYFWSQIDKNNFQMTRGLIDIIRKNYVITPLGIDYKVSTGDGWSNYISHELIYDDSKFDKYIGTNVAKQNNGVLQNENVKKFLQFIQREQESKYRSYHKNISDLKSFLKGNKTDIKDFEKLIKNMEKKTIYSIHKKDIEKAKELIHSLKPEDNKPINKTLDHKPTDNQPDTNKPINNIVVDHKLINNQHYDDSPINNKPMDQKQVNKPLENKPINKQHDDLIPVNNQHEDHKPINDKHIDNTPVNLNSVEPIAIVDDCKRINPHVYLRICKISKNGTYDYRNTQQILNKLKENNRNSHLPDSLNNKQILIKFGFSNTSPQSRDNCGDYGKSGKLDSERIKSCFIDYSHTNSPTNNNARTKAELFLWEEFNKILPEQHKIPSNSETFVIEYDKWSEVLSIWKEFERMYETENIFSIY